MKSPFPKTTYERNANIYRILANPLRLEILNTLKRYREVSVEELTKVLGIRKANVSQHLALLRHTGLVTTRKDGLIVYYKIIDPRVIGPCAVLKKLREENLVA